MPRSTGRALPALDARKDAKTEFFMVASHQLKSPLAAVQWCLRLLQEDAGMSPASRKLLLQAVGQADGMAHLLTDMLHVFRMMHGATDRPLEPTELSDVLEEAVAAVQPRAEREGVRLVPGPNERLPRLLTDRPYLKQALVNVLDNAVKYSRRGGTVTVSTAVERGEAVIRVLDGGIGVPEADRGRLFTEFFRASNAKEAAEGTGLGLVLVKQVVERLAGTVELLPGSGGKGTEAVLRIPAA